MSWLNDLEAAKTVTDATDFWGPNQIADEEDITPPLGISCQNVEYSESISMVKTRRGFKQAWNPAKIITTMYNWLQEQYNRIMYLSITDHAVFSRDLLAS